MSDPPNSYQTEPKEDERFYPSRVKRIVQSVINEYCAKLEFDQVTAIQKSEEIVKKIRERVKAETKMPRHKLAFQVILGEVKGQAIRIASKSLWDVNFDNWASYTFQNDKIFCTGLIFGHYYE